MRDTSLWHIARKLLSVTGIIVAAYVAGGCTLIQRANGASFRATQTISEARASDNPDVKAKGEAVDKAENDMADARTQFDAAKKAWDDAEADKKKARQAMNDAASKATLDQGLTSSALAAASTATFKAAELAAANAQQAFYAAQRNLNAKVDATYVAIDSARDAMASAYRKAHGMPPLPPDSHSNLQDINFALSVAPTPLNPDRDDPY